ncbi:MAG: discoidin domain-containing protein, partial [Planctomycetes bacterium]|nr:discoidin domain-containing protein [Planctomycetota bacterium]
DGVIAAENRWHLGSGHGWAGANMVFWNSKASGYRVQNPPTAQNWVIGSKGSKLSPLFPGTLGTRQGNYDSHGTRVQPNSLYEAQVADAATLRDYRWTGGNGNWSDALNWDQHAAPAVRTIDFRDYLIGDVDGFKYDGNADDDYFIDPDFKARIEAASAHGVGGFDVLTTNRNVAFTHQYQLDSGDNVVHATLAMGIRPAGGTWGNDTLQIDGVGQFAFGDLGWDRALGKKSADVFDLSPYLPVVQTGELSVNINDDTAADFALLSLTVASETPDPRGASVMIAGGGRVTVDSPVSTVGQVEVSGSDTRLNIQPDADLHVMRDLQVDASVRMTGGSLHAGSLVSSVPSADFEWTGGQLTVGQVGFDLVQQGGTLTPGGAGAIGTTSLVTSPVNLAVNGSAFQSSLNNGGVPERAIDGNMDGRWSSGSVTHTTNESQPWWRVDLAESQEIHSLSLWNRTDCCGDRLSNFRVSVLDDAMIEVWGADYFSGGGQPNPTLDIDLPGGLSGRHVQVQLLGTNFLSLAEVEVLGIFDAADYEMLGGTLAIDIAGLSDHDIIDVAGNASLRGTLEISLLNGFVPELGDTFDVLTALDVFLDDRLLIDQPTSLPGTFSAWTVPGGNGEFLRLGYEVTGGATVPEPSTLMILLLGLLCLALRRWRRKR